MRTELGLYRTLLILCTICLPTFKYLLPNDGFDPIALRLGVAGASLALFTASFYLDALRKRIALVGHIIIYLLTGWAAWLVYENGFENAYVINFFVVQLASSINFRRLRAWIPYAAICTSLGLASCLLPEIGTAQQWAYFGLLVVNLGISAVATSFRITIGADLNRQRNFVSSIFESSADAVLIAHSETYHVLATNQNMTRLMAAGGLRGQEIVNQALSQWLSGFLSQLDDKDRSTRSLRTIDDLDGRKYWVEVQVTDILTDQGGRLLVTMTDVTEKQLIASRLEMSDYILQLVDHIVLVSDENADIIYATPSVERILGYRMDEVMGQGWWNIKRQSGEDPSGTITYIKQFSKGLVPARPSDYQVRHIDQSGKEQWILWKDSRTDDGLVMGVGMLYTKAHHDEVVRSVILNIAGASSNVRNPAEFYPYIHREIRRLIDTPNFYIAVYDAESDEVYFPYYSDAEDSTRVSRVAYRRKAGKGLTEYGIKQRKPVLLSRTDIDELGTRDIVNVFGTVPELWLGVPLMHEDEVLGLITIQNYERADAYSQDDLLLVSFVAGQVAQFVAKLHAEEALRLSEERFRSIYSQAAVGIAQLTPEGNFLQVNQKMEEIFGYSPDELMEMVPSQFTHPDDVDLGQEELIEVMEGKRPSYTKEKRYIHKSGRTVYALLNVSAYREEGETIFVVCVYEDITEKKRAQSETELLLRLSSGLNKANSMAEAVEITLEELAGFDEWGFAQACWLDTTGKFAPCGKPMYDDRSIAAVTPEELAEAVSETAEQIARSVIWHDQPESAALGKLFQACMAAGAKVVAFLPIFHEDRPIGIIHLASAQEGIYRQSLEKLASAVRSQLVAVHLRKIAEQARIESENRYRAITQAAFEGIAVYQGERIVGCNTSFAKIFGYDPKEFDNIPLGRLFTNVDQKDLLERLEDSSAGSQEFEGLRKDGESFFVEALSQVDQWQGQPARILAVRDITGQKQMEESREAARLDARFRAYIQNSSEIIKIIDSEGRIQYCSPSYDRLFVRESESIMGMDNASLIEPEDRGTYLLAVEEVKQNPGMSPQLQLRQAAGDGGIRVLQAKLTNLIDDPLIKGILISESDITHVIEAQKLKQESEQRFKMLFERSPDAIFVESEDGTVLDVNDAACALHEMTRDELVGRHVASLTPTVNQASVREGFKDLMAGRVNYLQGQSLTKGGRVVEVEIRCNVVHFQNQPALLLLVRDITQRLETELALRESERSNKALLDGIPDLILRLRPDGTIINHRQSDKKGQIQIPDNASGKHVAEVLPNELATKLIHFVQLAIQEGKHLQFESELKAGVDETDYETRVVPSGNLEALAIIRDVTERKRTEKELLKRNFELDSFVYRASHDLKAPLNSLMGLISLIENDTEDKTVLNYIQMMNKSVVKLDTFIRDLADFSRNARLELEHSRIDWQALLEETLSNLQFADGADRIEKNLQLDLSGEFMSDPVRIGIILNNLVSNAIKYQNLKRADAKVDILIVSNEESATITVRDNGIGIPLEHQAKVYNLFFRASIQSYGSGMGMYIVKQAIERIRGKIALHSEEGKGTTWEVEIPNLGRG